MTNTHEQCVYEAVKDLIQLLNKNKYLTIDIKKDVVIIKTPAELDNALQKLGWIYCNSDDNGWSQDTWYYYSNADYDFGLIMEYSGFYWSLKLYRSDNKGTKI